MLKFLYYFFSLIIINYFVLSRSGINLKEAIDDSFFGVIFFTPILIQSLFWSKRESKIKSRKLLYQAFNFFSSGALILLLLILVALISLYLFSFDVKTSSEAFALFGFSVFIFVYVTWYLYLLIIDTIIFTIYRFLMKKRNQTLSP